MDSSDRNARYVVGQAPVNRRTADAHWLEEEPDHPEMVERARQLRQRHELGAPLVDLLHGSPAGPRKPALPAVAVACLIAGTALLPLAALSGRLWVGALSGGASLALLSFAGWRIAVARRSAAAGHAARGAPLIDAQTLGALDNVLDAVAPELDDALLQQLLQLKHLLVRLIELEHSAGAEGHFSSEDQLYRQQCVKRYLPDSLLAYVKVPPQHRHRVLAQAGSTPAQALSSQLALMQQTLERQEAHSVAAAGEALLRQQRFLQAKAKRPF